MGPSLRDTRRPHCPRRGCRRHCHRHARHRCNRSAATLPFHFAASTLAPRQPPAPRQPTATLATASLDTNPLSIAVTKPVCTTARPVCASFKRQ